MVRKSKTTTKKARVDRGDTEYLLSSPENAKELLTALARAERREGTPQTVESLRREMGLEKV
jgi:hypothetical protein